MKNEIAVFANHNTQLECIVLFPDISTFFIFDTFQSLVIEDEKRFIGKYRVDLSKQMETFGFTEQDTQHGTDWVFINRKTRQTVYSSFRLGRDQQYLPDYFVEASRYATIWIAMGMCVPLTMMEQYKHLQTLITCSGRIFYSKDEYEDSENDCMNQIWIQPQLIQTYLILDYCKDFPYGVRPNITRQQVCQYVKVRSVRSLRDV